MKIWTIPNILSLIRILLIAPAAHYLWYGQNTIAALICVFAALLDISDGYIARKFNQISELGKILDPIGDKGFFVAVTIILLIQGRMPLWFAAVIIGRDVLILIGGLIVANRKKIVEPSHRSGKNAAVAISLTLLALIVNMPYAMPYMLIFSLIFITISLWDYGKVFFETLRSPAKAV